MGNKVQSFTYKLSSRRFKMKKRRTRKYTNGNPSEKVENSDNWAEDSEQSGTSTIVEIKPNWSRILLLGFIISFAVLLLDIIGVILFIYAGNVNAFDLLTSQGLQYIVFGEIGLIVLWGGCIGNVGQSVTVNRIKLRLFGGRPMTKYSFRHATFHAFTYYFAGFLLFVYLISFVNIMKIIVSLSG